MRVIFYCDWFKEYTTNLVLAAAEHVAESVVITRAATHEFEGRREDEADLHSRLSARGARVVTLPGGYFSREALKLLRQRIYRRRQYAAYDVFHLQVTYDPRFLWMAWRMPTVLTLHEPRPRTGLPTEPGLRGVARRGFRRLYRMFADIIIVHTAPGLRDLNPRERRKARVIPHGVDVRPTGEAHRSTTILFFGRVAGYKGIDTLVAAMEEVWEKRPDARLQILANPGDGIDGLDTAVYDPRIHATWYGYSTCDLDQALSTARAVCLPYLSVSGSGVGAQALGAGVPIVASNLEGLREFVSHPDLLVEPGSVNDLSRALLAALDHDYPPKAIDPRTTWPAVAQAHLAVYESLIRRRRGANDPHRGLTPRAHRAL